MPRNIIVDPTRWSFENVKPYIFRGENKGEYDRGGNVWRGKNIRPPPAPSGSGKHSLLHTFPTNRSRVAAAMLLDLPFSERYDLLSLAQIVWLSNLPITMLGVCAKEIYQGIEKIGLRAAIPIDNRYAVGPE